MSPPETLDTSAVGTFPWRARDGVKHQLYDFLLLIGMRDRLRCPKCTAVGTYKPHGGWCDLLSDKLPTVKNRKFFALLSQTGARYATERRWVCKYCGYTHDRNGTHFGAPHAKLKVWGERCKDSMPTPMEAVQRYCGSAWPWRG